MNFNLAEMPLPLRFRPETPMSDEELMRFSAANDALRVERDANGEILVMTPAGSGTSRMNSRVTRLLDEWAEEDGRGVAFDSNGGFTLPDGSMRAADAAWVLSKRWEALSASDQARFAPLCPDFVIELRSPNDALNELKAKMEHWIANGAQLGWLIDPEEKTVHVYRPGDSPEVLHHPTSVQGSGVVAGFELVMARVWE
ncbi:Uma2 family endonuclease [Edaphobacter sp.]|uniref:Uma2 family endonuclease n=1 Tax=Edaphobacter sp. TaxID=1934404 RepID=UPI002DBE559D|nr:Uma2 family endonuclease [Edaphobacter sp.]HEU5340064.1 Uma2 family endonuclease [Edaphobacter sp.]